MTRPFDIFLVETEGVRWLQSAVTLEEAKAQVREYAGGAAGEYLLLDQVTGKKIVLKLDGSMQDAGELRAAREN